MNQPLDEYTLKELNRRILRFFLRETKSIGDLLRADELKHYPPYLIRRSVYALTNSKLLDCWGATSGKNYRTAHLGWIILLYLENESFSDKSKESPRSGIQYE